MSAEIFTESAKDWYKLMCAEHLHIQYFQNFLRRRDTLGRFSAPLLPVSFPAHNAPFK